MVLQDTLTRGEQTLADTGGGNAVLDLRRRWRRVMETQMRSEVENRGSGPECGCPVSGLGA